MSERIALHAICPYFAMFPESFVRKHVLKHSKPNDWVLDPFCGRGTTVLESLLLGRQAAGTDINPVAYCISRSKAERPNLSYLVRRVGRLEREFSEFSAENLEEERVLLPPFFRRAFYASTLREILFLRKRLDWQNNRTDRFIAALVLGSLHGEMKGSRAYFSNQMPRTICLKPDYSLRYWRKNGLFPKKRLVFEMLKSKATKRLKDLACSSTGRVRNADARKAAQKLAALKGKISLVITSPPYLNVTRYEEDQWLRIWFLGGEPRPTYGRISKDDRHERTEKYWQFLTECWSGISPLLKKRAILVIRIGAIGLNKDEITEGVAESITTIFPQARMITMPIRTKIIKRQATNFLPNSKGCLFEMDYVFQV